jgi:cytochrome c oxidase subunit 2|uniref:Cytochrome c oxidase subunit 2 n=1 Tax=Thecamonas trahens TaxID=529818 RepID=A0A0B5H7W3_THETB|nr:cytochrome c oxidase subunit 2 [Thecamonas trahens]AJF36630.1 cytochrome c oxidase subunit 2 [Thecamonas trahens]
MKFLLNIFNDAPLPYQTGFQDSATPGMEGIVDLHHTLLMYLTVIFVFVCWMLYRTIWCFGIKKEEYKQYKTNTTHGGVLEIIWTVIPAFILAAIAIPSFGLLYMLEEVVDPAITVKVIGHQWYWSYEYSDYVTDKEDSINYDSYMVQEEDLEEGQLRLLEVDNSVVLPINTSVRFLISSADVLHCFAVPSLGLKLDAVPGRLNQVGTFIKREGVFYGQCSEICGVNHGFMPIKVEAVKLDDYISWIAEQIEVEDE